MKKDLYKNLLQENNKTKVLVQEVLLNDNKARNSDLWLLLQVWRKQGIRIYVNYEDLQYMIPAETITRHRRKFNEKGEYLPTNLEVIQKRKIKQDFLHSYYAGSFSRPTLNLWGANNG